MKKEKSEEIKRVRTRLRLAYRRALYWSGSPASPRLHQRKGETSSIAAEKYELAMCDIENLSFDIAKLTGKPVPVRDIRSEFQTAYSKLFSNLKKKANP